MAGKLALELLFGLIDRTQVVSNLIATAKAEGRDISDAEIDALVEADGEAKARLEKAIEDARNAG